MYDIFPNSKTRNDGQAAYPMAPSAVLRVALILLFGLMAPPADAGFLDKLKSYFSADKEEVKADSASPGGCGEITAFMAAAVKWPEACGTGRPPFAVDPRYMSKTPYEGQWDVVFQNSPKMAEAFVVVNDGLGPNVGSVRDAAVGLISSGMVRETEADKARYHFGGVSLGSDGSLEEVFGAYGACNCIPFKTTVRPSGDPNVLVGHWELGDDKGVTIWRRRPPIKILSVVVHDGVKNEEGIYVNDQVYFGERPARIERDHPLTCGYGNMPGNCPKVFLSVRGQGFSGAHDIWLDPASHMGVFASLECSDGRLLRFADNCTFDAPLGHGNMGIRLQLIIRNDIKPGPRTLWVNGQPVPFELIINNFPDETEKPNLVSLEAWDTAAEQLQELPEGVPFMLQAAYDADHPDEWVTVDIPLYASSKKQVVLYRLEDPKVFESDWLSIVAGTQR